MLSLLILAVSCSQSVSEIVPEAPPGRGCFPRCGAQVPH